MVEGLTTSASDPGSGTEGNIGISDPNNNTTRSWISKTSRRPRSNRSSARTQPITIQQQDPGDASGEAIPVPIPNTEVKLSSAEDTERAAFRENRSSPGSCAFRRSSTGPPPVGYAARDEHGRSRRVGRDRRRARRGAARPVPDHPRRRAASDAGRRRRDSLRGCPFLARRRAAAGGWTSRPASIAARP